MEAWGWIVLYAVVLAVLQLVLYRAFVGDGNSVFDGGGSRHDVEEVEVERGRRPADQPGEPFEAFVGHSTRGRTDADAPVAERGRTDEWICSHCGAENERDETFDRCWNCAGRL
mgnify:CR=1 FL=1